MLPDKLIYIETFGCQMNERDSEIMAQSLASSYAPTQDLAKADLILVNTCSIRGKAEEKAYSLLGRLKHAKKKRPHLVIGVVGCVAQQEGDRLLERMPYLDLVVGPQNIYRLPELVRKAREAQEREVATDLAAIFAIPPFLPALANGPTHKRFVTIMQGCNNFCTYCVVPYTRGRENSRKANDILREVEHLVSLGVKEITLLGQNVNSYADPESALAPDFPTLLRAVAKIEGVKRLRFTTSNPKDLTEELMRCFAEIDILCRHFHLPVQSGSNAVLKRMNRKYDLETYLARVEGLRRHCPDIALTTDIIVGFPGESEADFEATMALVEKIRYHGAFFFKYSDRPNAKSAEFADKIPLAVKKARLARLQEAIDRLALERSQEYVGQIQELMVEGESKAAAGQWCGRTGSNQLVNFDSPTPLAAGEMVRVRIDHACQHTLRGTLLL